MKGVFEKYASYYDSIYQDKNYEEECNFLDVIFDRYAAGKVKSILDLGCGTGGHSIILAERGYSVDGVDRSGAMLSLAKEKDGASKVSFHQQEILGLRLEKTFDAVISMFAVMSYMTTNADLSRAFRVARSHLNPGGLFVFDSWFGPGVFNDPPVLRRKELVNKGTRIIRTTTPIFDVLQQVVDVQFDVVKVIKDQKVENVTEHHLMRPLFVKEVELFAELNSLELLTACPWMDLGRNIEITDWLAFFILIAK